MLRRKLLAVLLCLSVWAVAQRTLAAATPDHTSEVSTAPRPSLVAGDTHGSEASWDARHPQSIGGSGFSWSSQLQCVELPGVARREGCRRLHHSQAPRPPTPGQAPHLHDIPLLI